MKKRYLLLVVCLLIAFLAACGAGNNDVTEDPIIESQNSQPSDQVDDGADVDSDIQGDDLDQLDDLLNDDYSEPPIVVIGYEMDFPEEFEATMVEPELVVYQSPNSPMDSSGITVEVYEADESVLALDEDGFLDTLSEEADAFVNDIMKIEIDGFPALYVDYTVDNGDFYTRTLLYHVVATNSYVFTFTDSTDDNDWMEAYRQCAQTITFILENQGISLDYNGLELYELDCGMSMYAIPGLEVQNAEGFTACLGSHDMIVLVMEDNKETNDLVGLSLEEYAQLVSDTNDLEAFKQDNYGNLQTRFYTTDETGMEYFNMLTVKETEDSFWVFQLACTAREQVELAKNFSLISSSITAIE